MIGQRFARVKRHVAMLCVGLCMALSAQMTIAVLDRLQHTFQIEHAANGLAGYVVLHDHDVPSHSHPHRGDRGPGHGHHAHDGLPNGHDQGPLTHDHYGTGMLTPWLVSVPVVLAFSPPPAAEYEYAVKGHPDAPAWRRDRPPKLNLERIV